LSTHSCLHKSVGKTIKDQPLFLHPIPKDDSNEP
jgi:hypothetical protein